MTYVVGGAQTYSKQPDRYPRNAPRMATRAAGALVEADGNLYVDYVAALGAVILGHGYPSVVTAAARQLAYGVSFSLPTRLESELAERLCPLIPNAEAIRYAKNGADVTNAAIRIARAVTGRPRILMYEDGYHGASDSFMTRAPKNGGIPNAFRGMTVRCPKHDLAALEESLHRWKPAAFICEAVVSSDPVYPPDGYFREVRRLCDQHGALFILDEMVTGFRIDYPGAVNHFGIDADLLCYGKALANGHPLSVLVGRGDYMQRIEQDVFMSSTFGGEAVSLAAAIATLDVLGIAENRAAIGIEGAWLAFQFVLHPEIFVYGYPQRLMLRFNDDAVRDTFLETLIDHHVLTQGYFNLMLAHATDNIMDQTRTAIEAGFEAVAKLKEGAV